MNIYLMGTSLHCRGGGLFWSETTQKRKVMKDVDRWYPIDADRAPLGPYPDEILAEIDSHWALGSEPNAKLPDTFMMLNANHFSGAPFARDFVCDAFARFAEGNCQIVPIRKFWSQPDEAEVVEPYFRANVFNAADLVDLERTPSIKVVNPKIGSPFGLGTRDGSRVFVRPEAFTGRHLLRDSQTSEWFCDDVFREAIEAVTPDTYDFKSVRTD